MIELTQEFVFDAAHHLPVGGPENQRMHGHSFYAEVTLGSYLDADNERDIFHEFGMIKRELDRIRETLDHHCLNDVMAPIMPTLENITKYIFKRAQERMPHVVRVCVRRPSYGQSCTYEE